MKRDLMRLLEDNGALQPDPNEAYYFERWFAHKLAEAERFLAYLDERRAIDHLWVDLGGEGGYA